jgi:hypothetical protein
MKSEYRRWTVDGGRAGWVTRCLFAVWGFLTDSGQFTRDHDLCVNTHDGGMKLLVNRLFLDIIEKRLTSVSCLLSEFPASVDSYRSGL